MRRLLTLCGTIATLGGLGSIVLDIRSIPIVSDTSLVVFLGWSALLVSVLLARMRFLFVDHSHGTLPDVERGARVPVPGEGFDTTLSLPGNSDYSKSAQSTNREYVRSVLRERAITTLVLDANYTREEATQAVRHGSWTDDRLVSSFLSDEDEKPSLATQVRTVARAESVTEQVTRRTINEIERIRSDRP